MKYQVTKRHRADYCKKIGSSGRMAVVPPCEQYGQVQLKPGDIVESNQTIKNRDFIPIKSGLGSGGGVRGSIKIPTNKLKPASGNPMPTDLQARQQGAAAELTSNALNKIRQYPVIAAAGVIGIFYLIKQN